MIDVDKALENIKNIDPYLTDYLGEIKLHLQRFNAKESELLLDKTLLEVASAHAFLGLNKTEDGFTFREWLPSADACYIYGDFNGWKKPALPLSPIGKGVWEIKFKNGDIKHGQCYKLLVEKNGQTFERLPAYVNSLKMDERTYKLCAKVYLPEKEFKWTDKKWQSKKRSGAPVIYEAHVGMAQEKYGVGSYREFADKTLEWIKDLGYNTVQLMAIQEHPYYASFGYQVTNFFAPSQWFGEPDDLKYLINKAHSLDIAVLLDVVHSHACPNLEEGLHLQDGSEDQYFLGGSRGWHPAWKTRCFDYAKREVLEFLLSNLKYWMEEFHFDGFRFDGVTSMLYESHGLNASFTSYSQYFSLNTNVDARVYLMLANKLIHTLNPNAISIAEDMSGMPGACLPLEDGGFGFDYRLSMGVPDMWIKLIKEQPSEFWNVFYAWHELSGGRPNEKSIGYAESHDQALVGDKTLIFRLADAEMYTGMEKSYHSPSIDFAIDMHKLIRFITASLARGGYLNFMGNEFGHPEWVDFPREGNGWSYHYARRQWSLVENKNLKYEWLANFDKEMISFLKENRILSAKEAKSIWLDDEKKLYVFERKNLLFIFNMHPTWSQEKAFVKCSSKKGYRVIFSTDEESFGGQNRIDKEYVYNSENTPNGKGFYLYLPCRTAVVLQKQ